LKIYKKSKVDAKILPYPFTYISKIDEILNTKAKVSNLEDMSDLNTLEHILAARASILIKETANAINQSKEKV
jgi:hypothetical protein